MPVILKVSTLDQGQVFQKKPPKKSICSVCIEVAPMLKGTDVEIMAPEGRVFWIIKDALVGRFVAVKSVSRR